MYNHLIVAPERPEAKEDPVDPIKNKTRLKDISKDEYLKLRQHGLDLIQKGKGILMQEASVYLLFK